MNSQQYVITYHFHDSACPAIEDAVPIHRVMTPPERNAADRAAIATVPRWRKTCLTLAISTSGEPAGQRLLR